MAGGKNGSMLSGALARRGYDWWWHDLPARDDETGEPARFFIEYFLINPARSSGTPSFGQRGQIPSYAMVLAGRWGKEKAQLHAYYPAEVMERERSEFAVRIGPCSGGEDHLQGEISVSPEEAGRHPEWMSDPGEMSWDLNLRKEAAFDVGYGTGGPARRLAAFQMFWHVEGLRTFYSGSIRYNGRSFTADEQVPGYQDKNWGSDFTNPWIWLACSDFTDTDGRPEREATVDFGGGRPVLFGIPLGQRILGCLYYRGRLHQFNFSKQLFQRQYWHAREDEEAVYWEIEAENRTHGLELHFQCAKRGMLQMNYENPAGEHHHTRLWNGGFGHGSLYFYRCRRNRREPIVTLYGRRAGCELGRY
jgi:hypothetical protein